MPKRLVLLTYNLRSGTTLADYDEFMRAVDYPVFRARPEVRSYDAYRIAQQAQGDLGFSHFDLLEVDEFGDLDKVFGHPEVSEHAASWVDRWSLHGPDAAPEQNFGVSLGDRIE